MVTHHCFKLHPQLVTSKSQFDDFYSLDQCQLYDSSVQPIVDYGAEIWGVEKHERVHLKFCKLVLGLPKKVLMAVQYWEN